MKWRTVAEKQSEEQVAASRALNKASKEQSQKLERMQVWQNTRTCAHSWSCTSCSRECIHTYTPSQATLRRKDEEVSALRTQLASVEATQAAEIAVNMDRQSPREPQSRSNHHNQPSSPAHTTPAETEGTSRGTGRAASKAGEGQSQGRVRRWVVASLHPKHGMSDKHDLLHTMCSWRNRQRMVPQSLKRPRRSSRYATALLHRRHLDITSSRAT